MIGLAVNQNNINSTAGEIALSVIKDLGRASAMKSFLDRFTAQDLVTNFGFTIGDANLLKSAIADLSAINTTFNANRTFLNQLAGMGDVQ